MLYSIVTLGGLAALSWELLWQIHATLALGVSARGTAITLAATMGGMSLGALLAGKRLVSDKPCGSALRTYGNIELVIGVSGLLMPLGFRWIEHADTAISGIYPGAGGALHLAGILLVLGPPTMAMGASVPVFGWLARQHRTSLSILYSVNTLGAAAGVCLTSLWVLPTLGVTGSVFATSLVNLVVGLSARTLDRCVRPPVAAASSPPTASNPAQTMGMRWRWTPWVAALTGCVTFVLEVAWFRSLRAAFQDTTDSFAIILASVLLALAIGARCATRLARTRLTIPALLVVAGAAVLLATPVIERFDLLVGLGQGYWHTLIKWAAWSLGAMGMPMVLIGIMLPWMLDACERPSQWARLYAVNAGGAIIGAVAAAWILLPSIGFARTAWLAGALLVATGVALLRGRARVLAGCAGLLALMVAVTRESGLGRDRIQTDIRRGSYTILDSRETPDVTASVVEYTNGHRDLIIDGFQATSEHISAFYMEWMGRLPMLLHVDPRRALVIAFGTGQTARGALDEEPQDLDIAELSAAVLDMAPLFVSNRGVLQDPRTHANVIDGRAWLRRTRHRYDVITLEPMPPHFAGVNALYSKDFYELAAKRLAPGGIVAQWVPLHILPPEHATSVAATFRSVFPDSIMWLDDIGKTGILLGRTSVDQGPLGSQWPGLKRPGIVRSLSAQAIRESVRLDQAALAIYTDGAALITDDNQLLAFGDVRRRQLAYGSAVLDINLGIITRVARDAQNQQNSN